MGSFHPIAWYHNYDGGRSFYTALGHVPAVYKEQAFLNHIYAGIFGQQQGGSKYAALGTLAILCSRSVEKTLLA